MVFWIPDPFEIRTICKPTCFRPFKIRTSQDIRLIRLNIRTEEKNSFFSFFHLQVNSVSLELHHVKHEGSITWIIRDFLAWSLFRKDEVNYTTDPIQINIGNENLSFKFHLELNSATDDIGLYLNSDNKQVDFRNLRLDYRLVLNNARYSYFPPFGE